MKYRRQIELVGYNASELERARREIRQIHASSSDWEIWTIGLLPEGIAPDVSVIDARDKTWSDVFQLVNMAHSRHIVLLGNNAPRIGLHIVPTVSRLEEVIDEALHDSGFGEARAPDTLPAPLSGRGTERAAW
ncbi:MAG: hypothetical protein EON92_12930 [Burkholderiales bacterium]|nr:MAG: hypothetical protein EON92_12930 [Burkholderiales bacterium]